MAVCFTPVGLDLGIHFGGGLSHFPRVFDMRDNMTVEKASSTGM